MQRFLKKYWIALVISIIVVVIVGGYLAGYRVQGKGIVLEGGVAVQSVPKGASVYVDQVLQETLKLKSNVTLRLIPGNHTIIVSMPGDFPWSAVVPITSGKTTNVDPLYVPTSVKVVSVTAAQLPAALAAIASTTLPTQASPLPMQNGCANVYVSNNQVIEAAATSTPGCTPPAYLCIGGSCAPTIVFAPKTPVTIVLPYPGRQDAIAVQTGDTLYALALDPTSPQFFAPLVRGQNLEFGKLSNGSIVVEYGYEVQTLSL